VRRLLNRWAIANTTTAPTTALIIASGDPTVKMPQENATHPAIEPKTQAVQIGSHDLTNHEQRGNHQLLSRRSRGVFLC
jgi:hypothetical protein